MTSDRRVEQRDSDQIAQPPLGEVNGIQSGGDRNNKAQQEQRAHSRAPTHRQRYAFALDDLVLIIIRSTRMIQIFCGYLKHAPGSKKASAL